MAALAADWEAAVTVMGTGAEVKGAAEAEGSNSMRQYTADQRHRILCC